MYVPGGCERRTVMRHVTPNQFKDWTPARSGLFKSRIRVSNFSDQRKLVENSVSTSSVKILVRDAMTEVTILRLGRSTDRQLIVKQLRTKSGVTSYGIGIRYCWWTGYFWVGVCFCIRVVLGFLFHLNLLSCCLTSTKPICRIWKIVRCHYNWYYLTLPRSPSRAG